MSGCQQKKIKNAFCLHSERIGALPIVNHFIKTLQIEDFFEQFVPTEDQRVLVPYAKGLGVLLRSFILEREPIYRQQESVSVYSSVLFGLSPEEAKHLGDDRVGRALDRLFDADRGSLLTKIILKLIRHFKINLNEFHNDTTSIRLTGQYRNAIGRRIRGKKAPWITYGFSKDHRPDLKQLMFLLTLSDDGGIPIQFRCESGNKNDSRTHQETWQTLADLVGRNDFLYVADSKLCSLENMDFISRRQGRFITVLPRSRKEDELFRKWIQTSEPEWELVWDRPNPKKKNGPRDIWKVWRFPVPSAEGWPVIWVYSSLLALRQQRSRLERCTRVTQELNAIQIKLKKPRPRRKSKSELKQQIDALLEQYRVKKYISFKVSRFQEHKFRQERRGRPDCNMRYRRITKNRLKLTWQLDVKRIDYDKKSDGMYPLLTNDRSLKSEEILKAHKRQPKIEKRFQQLKSVYEIAPVFLKNEARIEAFFFIYFLSLLIQSLIERQIRLAMKKNKIDEIPLYPEERNCKSPTTDQVLRIFSHLERHHLKRKSKLVQLFDPSLTDLQKQILKLLQLNPDIFKT